jgi:hypothetical protein
MVDTNKKNLDFIKLKIDQAINDWPENIIDYYDFHNKVKKKLNTKSVNFTSIDNFMKLYSSLENAWFFEALEYLKEIKELKKYSLDNIIDQISSKVMNS